MNPWRAALNRWSSDAGRSNAIKDEQFEMSWSDIDRVIGDLSTIPMDWQYPLIVAGQRNSQMILSIAWALSNDAVGLNLERSQIASTLGRIHHQLPVHHLLVHEFDLVGFGELFRDLGYDLGQAVVLDAFEPDRLLGRPVIVSCRNRTQSSSTPSISSDCGWLLMTSGTTAAPKLVMVERQDLVQRALGEIRDFEIVKQDVLLNLLPVSHDVGFNQILSWLMAGCGLVVQSSSSSDRLRKNLAEEHITGASGTPLMWSSLFRGVSAEEKFESVRFVTVSGGTLPLSSRKRLQDVFPQASVYRTYGQTETFRSLIQKNELTAETHGKPLAGVQVRLIDESGAEVANGVEGELVHSGAGAMLGYLHEPGSNAKWREVRTGDYFVRDDDGAYKFRGRRDDLIKRWETRMHLSEVEAVLLGVRGVSAACVLHRPAADHRQNELAAFVIAESLEGKSLKQMEEAIMQDCARELSTSKIPDEIFVIEDFPKTASQKMDRNALRAIWEKKNAK